MTVSKASILSIPAQHAISGFDVVAIDWMRQIQTQLVKADAELKPMVKGVPQTTAECHTSLMKIVSDYCRLLRQVGTRRKKWGHEGAT